MFNLQQHNKQCEEEFDERFTKDKFCKACNKYTCEYSTTGCPWYQNGVILNVDDGTFGGVDKKSELKSFITTSNTTLLRKFLESERERLEKMKRVNEEFGFCKHCNYHMGDIAHDDVCLTYNDLLDDQITHINNLLETLK